MSATSLAQFKAARVLVVSEPPLSSDRKYPLLVMVYHWPATMSVVDFVWVSTLPVRSLA